MKKKARKKLTYCIVIMTTLVMILLLHIPVYASAYDNAYNIHNAIAYAKEWSHGTNEKYGYIYPDCTNFVSQCLVAGGIKEDPDKWSSDSTKGLFGYSDAYNTFVNVGLLASYLKDCGYSIGEIRHGDINELKQLHMSAGDILQIDHQGDGEWDHSMICVGIDADGQFWVAGHEKPYYGPINGMSSKPVFDGLICNSSCFRVIGMTNTIGLTDVTRRYIGKTIAIKSIEVDRYVSSNTEQDIKGVNATANSLSASKLEYFDVIEGEYGEVGFRAHGNNNYLSARVDEDSKNAYIQAAYGQNYTKPQNWESFRIFERDGIQYIQSQANGKWMQVAKIESSNPLKAAGSSASTWERFQIEVVKTSSN